MPLIPNVIERFLLFRLNLAPAVFLDIAASGALHAVTAAVKLGVFESIAEGRRTADEVARSIRTDPRSTMILLENLTAFGYVRRSGNQYANSPTTRTWLSRRSSTNWADVTLFWEELVFPFWRDHAENAIRQGKPDVTIYEWLSQVPGGWRIAQAAFQAYSRPIADPIAAAVSLPSNARRLLDVGGGHGLYSIAFCRRFPVLSATIFDLPEALASARENAAATHIDDRISLQPGDYRTDSLGEGYDAALLFSILHAHRPDENLALLRKVAHALNPGGVVVVLDNVVGGPSRTTRAIGSHFGLTYLIGLGGQTYSQSEIEGWLTAAGFSSPRRVRVRRAAGLLLLTATKAR